MKRNCLVVLAWCGAVLCVACGHSAPPANSADSSQTNPSADSGTIDEMTDNHASSDTVDGGEASGKAGNSAK